MASRHSSSRLPILRSFALSFRSNSPSLSPIMSSQRAKVDHRGTRAVVGAGGASTPATTTFSVVAIPVDSSFGEPTRFTVSTMGQVACLLCPKSKKVSELHTTPCPKCPDQVSIFTELRPISEPLSSGESTTCILTHPTLMYPALKDNVHFAGLIPHRSLDGTVVIVQLQKVSADYVIRELPTYIGTVNPAADVFRPIMRGWRQYNKRNANGALVPALPYNPTRPFSYSEDGDDEEGNDGEGGSWWTYDGQKLPEQDDEMDEDN